MNNLQGETALIIIGVILVGEHAFAAAMFLRGRWKMSSPNPPKPPKTPAAAPADVAPGAAADQDRHLASAA